ncbi:hypothetical protein [Paenibacillus turpanensis]|uniref:hypothetical protein n=1 Tax=Paenibacillus turpanensis TaxID=2689078 RepID=UPI00140AC063|nr:hypothetical protein [Paenibacillus turpanensis]
MDKKKYYVSVQAGTVMENQGDSSYELEIEATPKEVEDLQELFEGQSWVNERAFWRAHVPGVEYHHDAVNDYYDDYLVEIYRKIYELGTRETREHIQSMNILNANT